MLAWVLEVKTGILGHYSNRRQFGIRSYPNLLMRERIAKEIQHGRFLAEHGAGEIWNWESPPVNCAGRGG